LINTELSTFSKGLLSKLVLTKVFKTDTEVEVCSGIGSVSVRLKHLNTVHALRHSYKCLRLMSAHQGVSTYSLRQGCFTVIHGLLVTLEFNRVTDVKRQLVLRLFTSF
jgi:hypothetical protein